MRRTGCAPQAVDITVSFSNDSLLRAPSNVEICTGNRLDNFKYTTDTETYKGQVYFYLLWLVLGRPDANIYRILSIALVENSYHSGGHIKEVQRLGSI